jgi:hypothetical protein
MTQRQIQQVFETYQKARLTFVQTIADLSSRPQNVSALQDAGVMSLLRPLLLDTGPFFIDCFHLILTLFFP